MDSGETKIKDGTIRTILIVLIQTRNAVVIDNKRSETDEHYIILSLIAIF